MLRLRHAQGFDSTWDPEMAARSAEPTHYRSRPIAVALRGTLHVLGEAFAARRRYEHLTSKGTPHDTALRQALRIPNSGK
jgi:hypothetical protein